MSSITNTHTYISRQNKLVEALRKSGIQAMLVNPGPSLVYLTGLHFHLSERPVVAIFTPGKPVTIALPELESLKVQNLPFPAQSFLYGEDPRTWSQVFGQAGLAAGIGRGQVGIEPRQFRVLELRLMESALPGVILANAEDVVASLRMQKDSNELAAMRKAVQIAQAALQNTVPMIKIGLSEKELATELVMQLLRSGAAGELPFQPIVSGGPNGATGHNIPGDRKLQAGDLLVIDWGATYEGYTADLTRTFAIGEVEPELQRIAQVVLEANIAGRAAGKPGVPARAVDYAARGLIEAAGYGKYFTHRTGHGLGMEVHEPPYMRSDNEMILLPGMTYTVEPGIYLPGRGGVRIEDNMVITNEGAESLSDLPRELAVISG